MGNHWSQRRGFKPSEQLWGNDNKRRRGGGGSDDESGSPPPGKKAALFAPFLPSSFSLEPLRPTLVSRDKIVLRWQAPQDLAERDSKDVGRYRVEVKMPHFWDWTALPWLDPAQAEIHPPYAPDSPDQLVTSITLTRFDERKPGRKVVMVNPGTRMEVRVRAMSGRLLSAVSPTLACRFLDGPINIRYRNSAPDQEDGETAAEEVAAWDQLTNLQVDSSMSIGSLRAILNVHDQSRLILLFRDLALHRHLHHQDGSSLLHVGVPLDNHLDLALHDVPELQPCYNQADGQRGGAAALPEIYQSPPIKTARSFGMALFFSRPEGLASELKPDTTFPFPSWVEADDTWTPSQLKEYCCAQWSSEMKPEDLRLWGTNGLIMEDDKPFNQHLFRAPTYPYLKVDLDLKEGQGEFTIRVCDASNKEQMVVVTEGTTLTELAERCDYSVDQVLKLYQLHASVEVGPDTTLASLGFSYRKWLLHHKQGSVQPFMVAIDAPQEVKAECEFFPSAEAPFSITLPVFPDTRWDNLSFMIDCALWSLLPQYRPSYVPSLRQEGAAKEDDTVATCLRGREREGDGVRFYPLLVKLRPLNWAAGKAQ